MREGRVSRGPDMSYILRDGAYCPPSFYDPLLTPIRLTYNDQIWHGKTWWTGAFLLVSQALGPRGTSVPKVSWDPVHAHARYEEQ